VNPRATWEFEAEIRVVILHRANTLINGYSPMIIGVVRGPQCIAGNLLQLERRHWRCTSAPVDSPERVCPGWVLFLGGLQAGNLNLNILLFREGRAKGAGHVTKVCQCSGY
jgi:hypothetical protein